MGSWNSKDCQREEEDDGQGSNITSKLEYQKSWYYSARMHSWSSEDFQSDEEDDSQEGNTQAVLATFPGEKNSIFSSDLCTSDLCTSPCVTLEMLPSLPSPCVTLEMFPSLPATTLAPIPPANVPKSPCDISTYIKSSDSVKVLEFTVAMANTGQDHEKQDHRISYQNLTAHESFPLLADEIPSASSSNPPSLYYSARIQSMVENKSKYRSEREFEIESSKVHWSELDPASQTKRSGEMNRKYWEELKFKQDKLIIREKDEVRFWGQLGLFREMDRLVVGDKIAEGAQADIYAASLGHEKYVVKVFKAGFLLRDLEKQWPPGMVNALRVTYRFGPLRSIHCATLLKDDTNFTAYNMNNRFAFVMKRCWGDLRKLIDQQMIRQSSNQGPPFTTTQVLWFMFCIADDMFNLHTEQPCILHKDLKAANVLVKGKDKDEVGLYKVTVTDFECSVGVVGTAFWRAPEILQQLKDRVPSSKMEFTEKCDVYSFGMTCYELVTGRIPFEGHRVNDYDLVLNRNRPELPLDLDSLIKGIITSCWNHDPSKRPDFSIITRNLLKAGHFGACIAT